MSERFISQPPSIEPPRGIRPLNPVPVDWYSGPFTGGSTGEAVQRANASIFLNERFRSMEVRLLVGSDTYKYWYYGGTADSDLVPFSAAGVAGAGSTGYGFTAAFVSGDGHLFISTLFPNGTSGNERSIGFVRGNTGNTGIDGVAGSTGYGFTAAFVSGDGQLYISVLLPSGLSGVPFSIGYVKGDTGSDGIAGNYVSSINSLTGSLQVVAGENVSISLSGNSLIFSSTDLTFSENLTAGFTSPRSFGKYTYGQTIPAKGKTALQVIKEAMEDVNKPTVTIDSNPTNLTVLYNQTTISNQLTVGYTILTIGATATSSLLEYRRENESNWTPLRTDLFNSQTSYSATYTHSSTTEPGFNQNDYIYRYTVYESSGATNSSEKTVPVQNYSQYTNSSFAAIAIVNRGSPIENNNNREFGNTGSNFSLIINTPCAGYHFYSPLGYSLQYSTNGGVTWQGISTGQLSFFPSSCIYLPSSTIPAHYAPMNVSSIQYRVLISDSHTVNFGLPMYQVGTTSVVNFGGLVWHGPTAAPPTTSAHLRSGGLSAFNLLVSSSLNTNPFFLNTGTVYQDFVVALPKPYVMVSATDDNNAGANVFPFFLTANSSIGWEGLTAIQDYSGVLREYNIYNYHVNTAFDPPGGKFKIARST